VECEERIFTGGSAMGNEKSSNGFSRVLLHDFTLAVAPPKHTNQASLRILKTRDGRQFIGKQTNSRAKQANKLLKFALMPYKPLVPHIVPLEIYVTYAFPFNKTEKKSVIALGEVAHTKRPDADNLMKGLFDVMGECGYWKDDSQLSVVHFKKVFSANPRIGIKILELAPLKSES